MDDSFERRRLLIGPGGAHQHRIASGRDRLHRRVAMAIASADGLHFEVVELRFGDAALDGFRDKLGGIGDRVDVLPDRILLYADDGDAAVNEVHSRQLAPSSVLVRRSTLEDVFLHLTGRTLVD